MSQTAAPQGKLRKNGAGGKMVRNGPPTDAILGRGNDFRHRARHFCRIALVTVEADKVDVYKRDMLGEHLKLAGAPVVYERALPFADGGFKKAKR